jgi:hypothetical protein
MQARFWSFRPGLPRPEGPGLRAATRSWLPGAVTALDTMPASWFGSDAQQVTPAVEAELD